MAWTGAGVLKHKQLHRWHEVSTQRHQNTVYLDASILPCLRVRSVSLFRVNLRLNCGCAFYSLARYHQDRIKDKNLGLE